MRNEHVQPSVIAAAAVALGIWGNIVWRPLPVGINALLWIGPIVALFFIYTRVGGERIRPTTAVLLLVALFFASVPAVRASGFLVFLSLSATFFALALAALSHADFTLHQTSTPKFLMVLLINPLESAFAWFQWMPLDRVWPNWDHSGRSRRVLAITRGLLLSLPFGFIFISLFASADMQFSNFVGSFAALEFERAIPHIFFSILFSWLALTLLVFFYFADRMPNDSDELENETNTWAIELLVVLAVINVIFISYGYFQLGYLFGGIEHILHTPNLTVAQYARRGFFESAVASGLVLVILQTFGERLNRSDTKVRRLYTIGATIQLALGLVVVASAFHRIAIYTDTFGLTRDRLYVYVALSWMLLCFIWFLITLAFPWRDRFILGAIGLGFICLAAMAVLNPDATVVRINLARMERTGEFDMNHALQLSNDAMPRLAEAFDAFDRDQQRQLRESIQNRRTDIAKMDLGSWKYTHFRIIRDYE